MSWLTHIRQSTTQHTETRWYTERTIRFIKNLTMIIVRKHTTIVALRGGSPQTAEWVHIARVQFICRWLHRRDGDCVVSMWAFVCVLARTSPHTYFDYWFMWAVHLLANDSCKMYSIFIQTHTHTHRVPCKQAAAWMTLGAVGNDSLCPPPPLNPVQTNMLARSREHRMSCRWDVFVAACNNDTTQLWPAACIAAGYSTVQHSQHTISMVYV